MDSTINNFQNIVSDHGWLSAFRSKDTKPELIVRKLLHGHGFRYKLHDKKLPSESGGVLPNQ